MQTYPAARDGVMVLTYDGEEGLTKTILRMQILIKAITRVQNLEDNMK